MAKLTRKSDVQSSECAVCIPDEAKLMLREISPTLQKAHGFTTTEAVTFRQLSAMLQSRDPVEFKKRSDDSLAASNIAWAAIHSTNSD